MHEPFRVEGRDVGGTTCIDYNRSNAFHIPFGSLNSGTYMSSSSENSISLKSVCLTILAG